MALTAPIEDDQVLDQCVYTPVKIDHQGILELLVAHHDHTTRVQMRQDPVAWHRFECIPLSRRELKHSFPLFYYKLGRSNQHKRGVRGRLKMGLLYRFRCGACHRRGVTNSSI